MPSALLPTMLLIASLAWVDPDGASSTDLSAKFSKISVKSFSNFKSVKSLPYGKDACL